MLITNLIQNLESQIEMHQVLLETLRQELDLPASCSLLELEEIQSTRTLTVQRIQELESSRLNLLREFKSDAVEKLTLSDIVNTCQPGEQEKLINLKSTLNSIIERIRSAGKKNAEKATARIACFREVHNSIHKSFHRHPVYSGNGTMNQIGGSCIIKRSI